MKAPLRTILFAFAILFAGAVSACGGGESANQAATPDPSAGLTAEQLEHGIGPIRPFELGPIDAAMATTGETVYVQKCSACHKVAERYIGPALGPVLDARSPAYFMNMVMNPDEMIQKHPEAKALFAQYMTPMANQNLTEAEARAVLEYVRTQVAQ